MGQACRGIGATYKGSSTLAAPPVSQLSEQVGGRSKQQAKSQGVKAVQVQLLSPWASDKQKKRVVINLQLGLNSFGLQAPRLNFSPIFHRSHMVACQGAVAEQPSDGVLGVWQAD